MAANASRIGRWADAEAELKASNLKANLRRVDNHSAAT